MYARDRFKHAVLSNHSNLLVPRTTCYRQSHPDNRQSSFTKWDAKRTGDQPGNHSHAFKPESEDKQNGTTRNELKCKRKKKELFPRSPSWLCRITSLKILREERQFMLFPHLVKNAEGETTAQHGNVLNVEFPLIAYAV